MLPEGQVGLPLTEDKYRLGEVREGRVMCGMGMVELPSVEHSVTKHQYMATSFALSIHIPLLYAFL